MYERTFRDQMITNIHADRLAEPVSTIKVG